ncbi:MalY/PatB family protein [Eremococcus coleocola]|uniref:cysteine-S-conjugate beta-lyase n=1 Tax=Eremococcus coleocola ACS-139-V-Col8 TaxID=908337 RepID=E4KRI5_9LACT|nr:MalY/PatB family protein [Eremococcus coleocola]EFR30442.1 aminotransferase, class I/II [Eremococcus coleocola ACS-139-V-Col8]
MDFDKVIDRRGTYCTQWDYVADRFGEEDLLPFTISDTDFAVPKEVMDTLQKRLSHQVFGYTRWNNGDFQQAVMNWYQKRFAYQPQSEWILYSPSVIYSVAQLIQMKSNEGDGVIIQTPAYDAFFKTIEGNQRRVIENPLIYSAGYYRIDFEDLEEKLADPRNKILLFCSPHNPTGRVWTEEELRPVVSLCVKYNVFLISDEIHMDVVSQGHKHLPITQFMTNNVALVTSGSKTFNFPGLIFSYLILPNSEDRELFLYHLKNKDGLSSTSILGMEATMAAYNYSSDWVDELNTYIADNIHLATTFFEEKFEKVVIVPTEATYLMWIDLSGISIPMDEVQRRLVHIGRVAIMDGEVYGGNGEHFLRLNVGCPRAKLIEGLNRIEKSFEGVE